MVKEFGNSTDDSSEGDFGRCKGVGRSNTPGRDAGDDRSDDNDSSDDGDDEEDPEEDPEEKLDGIETQEKGVVREGYIAWKVKNQVVKHLKSYL